jgi:hypothetical protein
MMSRSICDNVEKDCLVANAAPNANPMKSRPFSLIWSLLSRTTASGSSGLPPRYRVSEIRYRAQHSISKTLISNAHSISTFCCFCTFDIVCRYRRYLISKVTLFDIEGDFTVITLRYRRSRADARAVIGARAVIDWAGGTEPSIPQVLHSQTPNQGNSRT